MVGAFLTVTIGWRENVLEDEISKPYGGLGVKHQNPLASSTALELSFSCWKFSDVHMKPGCTQMVTADTQGMHLHDHVHASSSCACIQT